jgi:hypothetical protein
MSDYPQITYRKHTFLSALAMGISTIAITLVISCTVLIIYGINFAGNQSEKIVTLAENAVQGLPNLQKSLPPVLGDLLNDRRQPDYHTQLDISAKTILLPDKNGMVRTTVEVINNGNEVVSLLSLRVVVLTANHEILTESNEWAATPIAADHDWRGPLMPGSRRYFTSSHSRLPVFSLSDLKTEVEITDIRIWNNQRETSLIDSEISSVIEKSGYQPIKFPENE